MIEGTVTGGQSATASIQKDGAFPSAVSPTAESLAGLTVRVLGTDRASVVGDSGAFRIENVPSGSVRLQFTSNLVDATTDLGRVSADQFVQIQVQLSAKSAAIVSETRQRKVTLCHAEGTGSFHAIDVSENAESAHRGHGDGMVGDRVPGQPDKTFDATCKATGPSVDIEKLTNGEDADKAPGPSIVVGSPVTWQYRVTNTGTVPLSGVAVTDDKGVVVTCSGQAILAPGASMTCTGSGVATLGQYTNLGTVSGSWTLGSASGTVTDSDASHYLGITPDQEEEDVPKVTLCHRTGSGRYVTINVSVNAEPAHRAHGDGKIGEAVPALPGKVFSADCGVQ